ncbi:hypothetical protein U1Q18_005924 [Sarracenia purpurea var. burkii]
MNRRDSGAEAARRCRRIARSGLQWKDPARISVRARRPVAASGTAEKKKISDYWCSRLFPCLNGEDEPAEIVYRREEDGNSEIKEVICLDPGNIPVWRARGSAIKQAEDCGHAW